ncbi:hypothetical protein [Ralstonia pseudosolanacearum]|uniref:hypothetical protein n=1 Tax=Ralstonia pseudosolanacearum TaxID=1310165 RepID=UPI003CFC5F3A
MENTYPPLQAVGRVGNVAYRITDLPAMFGMTLARLPVVLRLLLENTLRSTEGRERQRTAVRVKRAAAWKPLSRRPLWKRSTRPRCCAVIPAILGQTLPPQYAAARAEPR